MWSLWTQLCVYKKTLKALKPVSVLRLIGANTNSKFHGVVKLSVTGQKDRPPTFPAGQ